MSQVNTQYNVTPGDETYADAFQTSRSLTGSRFQSIYEDDEHSAQDSYYYSSYYPTNDNTITASSSYPTDVTRVQDQDQDQDRGRDRDEYEKKQRSPVLMRSPDNEDLDVFSARKKQDNIRFIYSKHCSFSNFIGCFLHVFGLHEDICYVSADKNAHGKRSSAFYQLEEFVGRIDEVPMMVHGPDCNIVRMDRIFPFLLQMVMAKYEIVSLRAALSPENPVLAEHKMFFFYNKTCAFCRLIMALFKHLSLTQYIEAIDTAQDATTGLRSKRFRDVQNLTGKRVLEVPCVILLNGDYETQTYTRVGILNWLKTLLLTAARPKRQSLVPSATLSNGRLTEAPEPIDLRKSDEEDNRAFEEFMLRREQTTKLLTRR